ncbi:hypothetical protein NX059_011705 [Plenodomus lindquistii]|nr:hypothetical protein NX059_011705 [Plenodomus lindquistii]
MRLFTFMLALAGVLMIAFTQDIPAITAVSETASSGLVLDKATCTEGEYYCETETRIVKCIGGQPYLVDDCQHGHICKVMSPRPIPYCVTPKHVKNPVAEASTTLTTVAAREVSGTNMEVSAERPCASGQLWSQGRECFTCENGKTKPIKHCRRHVKCQITDGEAQCDGISFNNEVNQRNTVVATEIEDPQGTVQNDNDISAKTSCTNGDLWARRRDCYTCDNGKEKAIKHCRRHYYCHIYDGTAQCGRSGPNDDWDKRDDTTSTVTAVIKGTPSAIESPHVSTISRRQETTCLINGQQYCCGKHMACKCEDNFEWVIDYCGSSDCIMNSDKAVCTDTDTASSTINNNKDIGPREEFDVTSRPDVVALIAHHTSTLSARAPPEDGTECGYCVSLHDLNAPLRTSVGFRCRNHPEPDGEYAVCVNKWCGLCIIFSERDCQGDIKWSGGPGQTSGDRKGQHAKSHFCM